MAWSESAVWIAGNETGNFYESLLDEAASAPQRNAGRRKIIRPDEMPWEMSRQGLLKHLINEDMNTRMETVDTYMQIIPPGSRSGRHRHLAEECVYILEGRGYDLHQDCNVEITDTYFWKPQDTVQRFDWEAGDVVYIPPNTIHQHFNADPARPVRIISCINRIYRHCGLNDLEQLEDAPEYDPGVELDAESIRRYLTAPAGGDAVLKPEVNDLLTRTGPGTPMGELFRRYWIPALLAEELAEDSAPPVRVKLLSERLIALRDDQGRYGLIDEFCAHRGASLWFGNNQRGGIRCAYHGWKYDVTGQCLEVPSEPDNSTFCEKVRLRSYPLVRVGDILWTYLGPPEHQPPLPEFEFATVPADQTYTSKRWQESNWLQALEGGIDSSHVSWLHSSGLRNDPLFRGSKGNEYNLRDRRPHFEVAESDGGLFVGVRRNAEAGHYYWRITPWVMPSFTMVPPRGDHPIHGHLWIPIDDENCWVFTFDYLPVRPLSAQEVQAMRDGHGVHNEYVPNTYRPLQNKDNDYLMDRAAQQRGDTFSGVKGIAIQDASLQESMGPIVDRTRERLVSSDSAIIKARRRLAVAALALRDEGRVPPGVDPAHHRVRSVSVVLPADESYLDSCRDAITAVPGVAQQSV